MDPEIENLHSRLHRQHGRDVVKGLRELEKTARKIANWRNHRHFNVRCVHNNVTPTSIRLKSSVKGEAAQKILRKTEKKLLNVRIRQCTYTLEKLEEKKEATKDRVLKELSDNDKQEVEEFIAHAQAWQFEDTKSKQRQKFDKLWERLPNSTNSQGQDKYPNITKRWVVNLSNIRLEPEADSLLKKGLNFAVTPRTAPVDEYITATELACKQLTTEAADSLQ